MALMNTDPVPVAPADAIAALEEDLPKVLKGRTLEEAGWTCSVSTLRFTQDHNVVSDHA